MTLDQKLSLIQTIAAILAFIVSSVALAVAWRQLVPLRREIEESTTLRRRQRQMRELEKAPREARELVGYDPRLTNLDWGQLTIPVTSRRDTIRINLSRNYAEFYRGFLAGDQRAYQKSVLLIDLVYMPEFLERKLIAPLGMENGLNFADLITKRAAARGTLPDPATTRVMQLMCTDGQGRVGALPVWINSHGRIMPDPQLFSDVGRLAAENSFDHLLHRSDAQRVFAEAGVQSFYIAFEFWAHLAYRGCRLFVQHAEKAFHSPLFSAEPARAAFASAVADMATRLRFSNLTSEVFSRATVPADFQRESAFAISHAGDARMIRESLALWKPLFSSELLTRTFPDSGGDFSARLGENVGYRPPFARRHDDGSWSYLSALGAYGLALPYAAAHDRDSITALTSIFMMNPRITHPYLTGMLQDAPEGDAVVETFVQLHARPPWPFWIAIEERLTDLLFTLFLSLDRSAGRAPLAFWQESVRRITADEPARAAIETFRAAVAEIAAQNAWTFSPVAP